MLEGQPQKEQWGAMTAIVLEYPNGRRHATLLDGDLRAGTEFELYGRRWHAVGPVVDWQTRNRPKDDRGPILCTSLGKVGEPPCDSQFRG